MERTYSYDDVQLIPVPSQINSREDVDISTNLGGLNLKIPIIASPMKGIVSPKLIGELGKLGGIGILHRFYDKWENWVYDIISIRKYDVPFGLAVELKDSYKYMYGLDSGCRVICIDVANGYLDIVKKSVTKIKNYIAIHNFKKVLVMAGNVATGQGAKDLYDAGADIVRVGIGTGGLCTTTSVTGVGVPIISALAGCKTNYICTVADGGIRTSGDIVKALCFSDAVMIGSLFGKCKEAAHNGIIYGMASRKLQEEYYHTPLKSIEGIEKRIKKTTTVKELVNELTWGIKSAFTYLDARNIIGLRMNAKFIEVR